MNYALCNRWVKLASCICAALQDWRLTKVLGDNWGNPFAFEQNSQILHPNLKRNDYFVGNGKKLIKNIASSEKRKFAHLENLANWQPCSRRLQ